jgi:alkylhydroperoxidase/carboxymuconolactone decarboxylase family protein YurZ
MDEYLPDVYTAFRTRHGAVASGLDDLASTIDSAGPLDERSQRLVKLGIAIGRGSEGAVRSSTRKALALGADAEEIRHAALLAITTAGFPTAIAAMQWIEDVLDGG